MARFGAVFCMALALMGLLATDVSAAPAGKLRDALAAVAEKTQESDSDPVANAAALRAILADPAFGELSQPERHTAQLLYGVALFASGEHRLAREPIETATAMPQATVFDWNLRVGNSFMLSDYSDAAIALTKIAQAWPWKLTAYRDDAIDLVVRELVTTPDAQDRLFALLNALHDAKWQPKDPFTTFDGHWLTLVAMRLERGDKKGAADLAEELHDPVVFLQMHADKRFDAIVRWDRRHYNVMKAFADSLADLKAKSAAAPDRLAGANAVAETLLALGRADEALALITDALARVDAKHDAFSDVDDKVNWTHDIHARILFALGRSDEAFAAMERGDALSENGSVNISQAINLADYYVAYDRPTDALAAVAVLDFSHGSPYGRMALEDARACALFELGNKAQLAQVLDYMGKHQSDGEQPFLNAMLYIGDLDAAAANLIARLDDPARRRAVLYYFQDYLPQPFASKRERAVHDAWISLRNRADVAAAIARVGRIEHYAIRAPGY